MTLVISLLRTSLSEIMVSLFHLSDTKKDTIKSIIVSEQNQRVNLGIIRLQSLAVEIGEVVVEATQNTETKKIDRTTYTVRDF